MLFYGWRDVRHVIVVGLPIYIILVALLRVTGTRMLSKTNAFDAVVMFALVSALATAVLRATLSRIGAVAGVVLLVGVQLSSRTSSFAAAWSSG